jgi:hypothetical protein
VVDKAALGQVSSEYFGFPCQPFHRLLHTLHHPSSGDGTIDETVVAVPNGHSPRFISFYCSIVCFYAAGFEAFTALTMKNAVFWDVALCGFIIKQRFASDTHFC